MYKTSLIKAPKTADDQLRYPNGLTPDIIETVLYADTKAAWYTQLFAPTLKGKTLVETCRNIWQFVKKEIPYKLDPRGKQWVKSPGRLWKEKSGDCKSFSVFTASCLKTLGIPYGYRFASYSESDPTPTHVYVYVPLAAGGEIILDSVWTGPFNTQKEFKHKQDKLMTQISYLGGIGKAPTKHVPGELRLNKPVDQVSEHEMDLLLARQRLEIEKMNSAAVGGPFNWQIEKYDKAIGVVNNALAALEAGDGEYIEGLGNHFDASGQPLIGGFFKKIGQRLKKIGKGIAKGVKAVAKAVVKVATFPLRLIAKGILEIYLPKAAPTFLYLFAAENILPDKMKAKRKKSEKFKNFVCKKIGMKESHFMGIVRNSLTKKLGMSPESYLAKAIAGAAVKGIGAAGKKIRRMEVNQQWRKRGKLKNYYYQNNYIATVESHPDSIKESAVIAGIEEQERISGMGSALTSFASSLTKRNNGGGLQKAGNIINKASGFVNKIPVFGGIASGIMQAISWIISKLGGGKEVEVTQDDLPDPVADAGNAFKYEDLKEDYDNINQQQKDDIKYQSSQMIDQNYSAEQASKSFGVRYPNLNQRQVQELASEVEEGYEEVTESDGRDIARKIKTAKPSTIDELEKSGGGAKGGICKC